MSKKIAVIGGGLSGTAAAHSLAKRGYSVTIIEQRDYIGGRVHSELVDGAAVEMGAGFLTKGYANLLNFMVAAGLDRQLCRQHSRSGIYRDRKVEMITPNMLLGDQPLSWSVKVHALPLLLKTLLGWRNLDLHRFWKADRYDIRSVADMFSSPCGKEFMEYVLQPTLNGYFYWSPEQTSEAMMRVLCKAAFSHGTYKMRGGLQRIPEAAAAGSELLLQHTVKEVRRMANDTYTVTVDHNGKTWVMQADGIVCATTATVVPDIFVDLSERQRKFFEAIQYSSAALIARTYRRELTYGDKAIAFPRAEGVDLASVTLSPEPAANNARYATIKTYASGDVAAELVNLTDSKLQMTLVDAMKPVHDLVLVDDPQPIATHIQRWQEALPHFDVGHFKRLRQFKDGEIEGREQAIAFAGDYIGGPFMEGAFTSGIQAAERLDARLRNE